MNKLGLSKTNSSTADLIFNENSKKDKLNGLKVENKKDVIDNKFLNIIDKSRLSMPPVRTNLIKCNFKNLNF